MFRSTELVLLRGYAAAATILLLIFSVGAFRQQPRQRFGEIDVERINVIEPDGTIRLAISDKARFPDPVVGGKAYPLRSGARRAGMIFFNDEGNENGGIVYAGRSTGPREYAASASLTFDQFNQDEAIALGYNDNAGGRGTNLTFSDRSERPIQPCADSAARVMQIVDTSARGRAMARLRAVCASELGGTPRLSLGRSQGKESFIVLSDPTGRPRLRLSVDSLGAPGLEFLDADGRVISRLPAK
jgi:hypothetical protein